MVRTAKEAGRIASSSILARNAMGARALMQESGLPVQYVPKISDLEKIVAEQPLQVVFYVNQNTRNFQMMRYGRPVPRVY